MGVFDQMGDPVCPVCPPALCQHHGAAYAEFNPPADVLSYFMYYEAKANGATIISTPITITERCCVAVNAAAIVEEVSLATDLEIERPLGTIRTTQEDDVQTFNLKLMHHAVWEVLDPGTYTYYLVNRAGHSLEVYAAWIKAIASDCEG